MGRRAQWDGGIGPEPGSTCAERLEVCGHVSMSTTYERLWTEVVETAAARGVTVGESAMRVMTALVTSMADDLPPSLHGALLAAVNRWVDPTEPLLPLQHWRLSGWQFLDARGTSLFPRDRSDLAVRALICVCWDEPFEYEEMEDSLDFIAGLADQYQRWPRTNT